MRLDRSLAVVLVLLLSLSALGVVSAHSNHVTVMPQVATQDNVVVESFFMVRGGFLVVHTDDGGDPGAVLGYKRTSLGYHSNVDVSIDASEVPRGENVTLWAVLHEDDGDGEFHPGDDPPIRSFGTLAGVTFPARVSDESVAVVSPGISGQPSNGSVRIRRVSVDREGFVVLRDIDRGEIGDPVGHAKLSPGTHENVTVEVDDEYFENRTRRFAVQAVVYADDGDGTFDPDEDRPIRVGDERISSRVAVQKVEGNVSNATNGSDGGSSIVVTASSTPNGTVETVGEDPGGSMPMPGFGPVVGLVAVLLGVLAVARRRR